MAEHRPTSRFWARIVPPADLGANRPGKRCYSRPDSGLRRFAPRKGTVQLQPLVLPQLGQAKQEPARTIATTALGWVMG